MIIVTSLVAVGGTLRSQRYGATGVAASDELPNFLPPAVWVILLIRVRG
jgi:hypothetical protein